MNDQRVSGNHLVLLLAIGVAAFILFYWFGGWLMTPSLSARPEVRWGFSLTMAILLVLGVSKVLKIDKNPV